MLAQKQYDRALVAIGKAIAATQPTPPLATIQAVQACFTPRHMQACLQHRWHDPLRQAWQTDQRRELVLTQVYKFVSRFAVQYRADICVYYGKILAGTV